jgi:SAM-dependent methyltransferase
MNLTDYHKRKKFFLNSEPWCVDRLEITDSEILISGWAVPRDGFWDSVKFFVNDEPVEFSHKQCRNDLVQVFPFWEEIGETGFNILIAKEMLSEDDETVIISRHSDSMNSKYGNYYFPVKKALYGNLPPARLRTQVHGSDSPSSFVLEGYSSYKKINYLFMEYLGKEYESISPILDWGCGCARVCRYMYKANKEVYGADVNGEGIEWCLANISSRFDVSGLNPPLPYPDNHFEAIYGISVLTHLGLEDQMKWIGELIRVTQKSGLIILSYHGLSSLLRFNLSDQDFEELQLRNYLNIGKNHSFGRDSDVGSKYYDTVQLAPSFQKIAQVHSLDLFFHSGVFGNHQDVMVIKKN